MIQFMELYVKILAMVQQMVLLMELRTALTPLVKRLNTIMKLQNNANSVHIINRVALNVKLFWIISNVWTVCLITNYYIIRMNYVV